MPEREKTICKVVSEGSAATGNVVIFGLPTWSFLPTTKKMDAALRVVRKDFAMAVEQRREDNAKGVVREIEDCLDAMFQENMNEREMFDHFMTLICAGHDTSAYFSSYLIFLLAKHQDVQDKLRAEVLNHFKGRTEVTPDDISELIYLAKVMQETLRYYAIIPGVTRKCTEETYIKEAGVVIPAGVEIYIPMSIMNR